MSDHFKTCTISRAPIVGKAFAIPMVQTPYKQEPTEHGPWWLFALPFRVKDAGYEMRCVPAPGDHANNTPEEIEEAVVTAVSLKFIKQCIEQTTPGRDLLNAVLAGDRFTSFKPFFLDLGSMTQQEMFSRLSEQWHHVFNDNASAEFEHMTKPVADVLAKFNAPTLSGVTNLMLTDSQGIDLKYLRVGHLVPGVVAVKVSASNPAGTKLGVIAEQRRQIFAEICRVFGANSSSVLWQVHHRIGKREKDEFADKDKETKFNTLHDFTFTIQLSDGLHEKLCAEIGVAHKNSFDGITPEFLTELDKVNLLRTSFAMSSFAYTTEAAWNAVKNLPVPTQRKSWFDWKVTEKDFVEFAECLSDHITAKIAASSATPSNKRTNTPRPQLPSGIPPVFIEENKSRLEMMFQEIDYLTATGSYRDPEENIANRLERSLQSSARMVFGIDAPPPFYTGLLDLFLRTMIDGDNFLKDIAAKSNMTVKECQQVIYRRVYETKMLFDKLDYLRIKPEPAITSFDSNHCDAVYHAKALRAIATAIRADGISESSRG